eukprot:sb/3471755/
MSDSITRTRQFFTQVHSVTDRGVRLLSETPVSDCCFHSFFTQPFLFSVFDMRCRSLARVFNSFVRRACSIRQFVFRLRNALQSPHFEGPAAYAKFRPMFLHEPQPTRGTYDVALIIVGALRSFAAKSRVPPFLRIVIAPSFHLQSKNDPQVFERSRQALQKTWGSFCDLIQSKGVTVT